MKYSEEQVEQLLDRVTSLLDSYDEADANYKDGQDRDHWKEKFGERLSPYSDKLKTLNGDDFDILEASRKEYHDGYSDLSDDEYVNSLEENIKKVLNRVWPEATEEQKEEVAQEVAEGQESTEDGTLTIDEVGKDVTSTEDDTAPGSDPKGEIEEPEEDEEEEDPTKAYVTELETYKANMPKRNKE